MNMNVIFKYAASFMLLFAMVHCSASAKDIDPNDLKLYQNTVQKAELLITEGKYEQALVCYQLAFKSKEPFVIDIHNALSCAIYSKSNKEIKILGKQLAQRGLPENYFLKKEIFKPFIHLGYWKEYAHISAENYRKNQQKYLVFRKEIDSIFTIEESINVKSSERFASTHNKNDSALIIYEYDRAQCAKALLAIFNKEFLPSEFEFGPFLSNDTALSFLPYYGDAIIHTYQGFHYTDTFFTKLLRHAMLEGRIKPETFAKLQDVGNLNMNYRPFYATVNMFVRENQKNYALRHYYQTPEIRQKIDAARKGIGLMPLDQEIRKINFKSGAGRRLSFIFLPYLTTTGLPVTPENYILIE